MGGLQQLQYQPSAIDSAEDPEHYVPGGLHPVSLGGTLSNGHFNVLHKLGRGGGSTVWLARDQRPSTPTEDSLVTLKILRADYSRVPIDSILDISIPSKLRSQLGLSSDDHPAHLNIREVKEHFFEDGPNGKHLCLVSPFAGPGIANMAETTRLGTGRLRGDVARKVAKQLATVIHTMHSAGFVHGDISAGNVLFQISNTVSRFTDEQIYTCFGKPQTQQMENYDGSPPGPSAPEELVAPIDITNLFAASDNYLKDDILLIDFGQSFSIANRPGDYVPAMPMHYTPPEVHFDSECTPASDVWCLGCTIFQIRAGYSLFDTLFNTTENILTQMVELLGPFPDRWKRKQGVCQEADASSTSPLRKLLSDIGTCDDDDQRGGGPVIDAKGTRLSEEEVDLLGDLLERMLKHAPEERLTMAEVVRHPWFSYSAGGLCED